MADPQGIKYPKFTKSILDFITGRLTNLANSKADKKPKPVSEFFDNLNPGDTPTIAGVVDWEEPIMVFRNKSVVQIEGTDFWIDRTNNKYHSISDWEITEGSSIKETLLIFYTPIT